MDKKRQITHEGQLDLGGNIIPCFVLDDGTRVLSSMQMQYALHMIEEPKTGHKAASRLPEYLAQKSLKPYLYKENNDVGYEPIIGYKGNQKYNCYKATALADICDAFLEARKSINLSPRQKIIADQSEILMRGFARVGIIALVDEATGYQYDRERFELEKILNAYVAKEVLKWQLTFGLDFYKEIFRLWGVPFTPNNIRRKPRFIAVLTNKYIYKQLPDGVLERIKEVTPKTKSGNYIYRFHQSLTPEIGREHQKKLIHEVTALATVSDTKEDFQRLFEKRFADYFQLSLFDNLDTEVQLSDFDRNLTKAIDYNPNS